MTFTQFNSEIKFCRVCKIELTDKNWYSKRIEKHSYICKKCENNYYERFRRKLGIPKKQYSDGTCRMCNIILTSDNSNYKLIENGDYICNPCLKIKNHRQGKKERKILKELIVEKYGGECECCGETNKEFLTIDHINGNGYIHRKQIGSKLYTWLKNNNYPKDNYRLLCMNCNFSLGKYGYCPHNKDKS